MRILITAIYMGILFGVLALEEQFVQSSTFFWSLALNALLIIGILQFAFDKPGALIQKNSWGVFFILAYFVFFMPGIVASLHEKALHLAQQSSKTIGALVLEFNQYQMFFVVLFSALPCPGSFTDNPKVRVQIPQKKELFSNLLGDIPAKSLIIFCYIASFFPFNTQLDTLLFLNMALLLVAYKASQYYVYSFDGARAVYGTNIKWLFAVQVLFIAVFSIDAISGDAAYFVKSTRHDMWRAILASFLVCTTASITVFATYCYMAHFLGKSALSGSNGSHTSTGANVSPS